MTAISPTHYHTSTPNSPTRTITYRHTQTPDSIIRPFLNALFLIFTLFAILFTLTSLHNLYHTPPRPYFTSPTQSLSPYKPTIYSNPRKIYFDTHPDPIADNDPSSSSSSTSASSIPSDTSSDLSNVFPDTPLTPDPSSPLTYVSSYYNVNTLLAEFPDAYNTSRTSLTSAERTYVYSLLAGECGNEPYAGKMLVAICIANAMNKHNYTPREVRASYGYTGWKNFSSFKTSCIESGSTAYLEIIEVVTNVFDYGLRLTTEEILYFYAPRGKYRTTGFHESDACSFVLQYGKNGVCYNGESTASFADGHRFFSLAE